jgi:hypothetical protein
MRRVRREVALFSLSALDALAMATGVFALLIVLLMPYYRNSFDERARLEGLRADVESTTADLDDLKQRVEEEAARAARALAETERISKLAASIEKSAVPRPTPRPKERPTAEAVTAELDLVFVVDTTTSMTPVLQQMTRSMASLVRILERLVPSVRVGIVAYRDYDAEPPLLRSLPPTRTKEELPQILSFVGDLRASRVSSGTIQEAVYAGMQVATALPFRPKARQAIVLVGDAAAHAREQPACLAHIARFVSEVPNRTVSALFVTTPSSLRAGNMDRGFFIEIAKAGRGNFTDFAASMTESVLMSVLTD